MACETPVVASAVGGIKEVVVDGETGFLVPLKQYAESPFEAMEPETFARDLAAKINLLVRDAGLRKRFGQAGRRRAVEKFSWHAIAVETQKMYAELIERHRQHMAG
jgi:alpha-maltose-1-phosphate synthase